MSIVKVETVKGKKVDVDTDEILSKVDVSDMLEELACRALSKDDEEYLRDMYGGDEPDIEVKTLDDEMKRDYLLEIFDKYTLSEIETKLPK